jgi:hypothetical protein
MTSLEQPAEFARAKKERVSGEIYRTVSTQESRVVPFVMRDATDKTAFVQKGDRTDSESKLSTSWSNIRVYGQQLSTNLGKYHIQSDRRRGMIKKEEVAYTSKSSLA